MTAILERPEYMPAGEPRILLDVNPLEYREVHSFGFHNENDGIIDYYDQSILFLAFIEGQKVIVTLLDEGYANDGMENHSVKNARGWDQHIAFAIDDALLDQILNSKIEFRSYMRDAAPNWFIHKDWAALHVPDLDRWDENQWYSVYRVFENVPVQEAWKPEQGIMLNPKVAS